MLEAPFHTPQLGPSVFVPAQLLTPIAAGGSLGPLNVIFPFRMFVYALTLTTVAGGSSPGSAIDLSQVSIEIQDGDTARIITDGQGWQLSTGGLGLVGLGGVQPSLLDSGHARRFAVQRLVQPREVWPIKLNNGTGATITVEVGFIIGTPIGDRAQQETRDARAVVRNAGGRHGR